jgi:hypothetical protein
MCCLAYEHEVYTDLMKSFPKVGTIVKTPKGEGKIKELLVLRGAVRIAMAPGEPLVEVPLKDVVVLPKPGAAPAAPAPEEEAEEEPAELKGMED